MKNRFKMKDKTAKEPATSAVIKTFIKEIKVNRMCELPDNQHFKWVMIEHNEFGYCWTAGYRAICTTIYSTAKTGDIKYWPSEAEAKTDLAERFGRAEGE